jgi:hypothetical protein
MPTPKGLGYLQRYYYEFCLQHPGRHTVASDHETIRIIRSLQRRGLLIVTDCGMCTAAGRPVLIVQVRA